VGAGDQLEVEVKFLVGDLAAARRPQAGQGTENVKPRQLKNKNP